MTATARMVALRDSVMSTQHLQQRMQDSSGFQLAIPDCIVSSPLSCLAPDSQNFLRIS